MICIGVAYASSSEWESANESIRQAKKLALECKAYLRWEEALGLQGFVAGVQGKFVESFGYYMKSYTSGLSRNDPHMTSIMGYASANNCLKLEQIQEGIFNYRNFDLIQLAEKIFDKTHILVTESRPKRIWQHSVEASIHFHNKRYIQTFDSIQKVRKK
jgi:hypothetical protein